ncbi:MAG: nuclear transport factor 2 family protein [Novosphingobium sp.]
MIDEERMVQLERKIQGLQDRQDILDCIVREARGRDRQDVELTLSAYWDDALDEHGDRISPAKGYPAQANASHAKFFAATNHNLANHTCEIDGDLAHCETYVIGALLLRDMKSNLQLIGRYLDRLERRNGEWRIVARRTIVDSALQGDGSYMLSRAVIGFPKGLWGKDDPSYQRPLNLEAAVLRW